MSDDLTAVLEIAAPDYQIARFVIERGLGAIYLIAFVVALTQFPPLVGDRGLELTGPDPQQPPGGHHRCGL